MTLSMREYRDKLEEIMKMQPNEAAIYVPIFFENVESIELIILRDVMDRLKDAFRENAYDIDKIEKLREECNETMKAVKKMNEWLEHIDEEKNRQTAKIFEFLVSSLESEFGSKLNVDSLDEALSVLSDKLHAAREQVEEVSCVTDPDREKIKGPKQALNYIH
jgi:ABC-type proline/glycine betaine transport system ATPase subunit